MSQTLEENISEKTLKQAGAEEQKGETGEEPKGAEEQDQFHVEVVKNFFKNEVETIKTRPYKKKK
jgi:hypothetical protein